MRGRFVAWVALMALPVAAAGETHITLHVRAADAQTKCGPAVLRVTDRCDSGGCTPAPVREVALTPGDNDVPLTFEEGHAPTVTLRSASCWAEPVTLGAGTLPGAGEAGAVMKVFVRGEVGGELVDASGKPVSNVAVDGLIQRRTADGKAAFDVATDCRVEGSRWTCGVPAAGPVALRLAAGDAVPLYFWNPEVVAGRRSDLGPTRLEQGASIAGWVRDPTPESVTLHLVPDTANLSGDAPSKLRIIKVIPTRRGFFQFKGVARGSYTIAGSKPGRSHAILPVTVNETREYLLDHPVELPSLANLDLRVVPPSAPGGGPWTVRVDRPVRITQFMENVAEGPTAVDGHWSYSGLDTGTYQVTVLDSRRSVFHRQQIDVPSAPLTVEVTAVPVEGRITAGDRPLKANIAFSRTNGGTITIDSDDDGNFSGVLSTTGTWTVRVSPRGSGGRIRGMTVDVHPKEGERVARLSLRMPGGRLRGNLVDEAGNTVTGSILVSHKSAPIADITTRDDGTFDVVGLDPGDAVLEAFSKGAESGGLPYTIGESGSDSVTIVVKRALAFSGVVLSPAGAGVPGAIVRCVSPSFRGTREAVTGLSGEFTLKLPPDAGRVALIVLASAYPVKLISADASAPKQLAEIVLSRSAGTMELSFQKAPPYPAFLVDGVRTSLLYALYPHDIGPPRELNGRRFEMLVEAGKYIVCGDSTPSSRCVEQWVPANGRVAVDVTQLGSDQPERVAGGTK